MIAGNGVGVGVGKDVAHVQRAAHGWGRRIDGVDRGARRLAVEDVGFLVVPNPVPVGFDAVKGGLVRDIGHGSPGYGGVGSSFMFRLYDTATSQVRELEMRTPGQVGIYLCGPTVYGPPHLGHGRATLVYDILRRYLEWTGLTVRLVSNITDIDDKIINRATKENRPWQEITDKCERMWFQAMEQLNVARPTDVPHATEFVDSMVDMIGRLVETGKAYATDDGVYLSVEEVPDYGLLAHQSIDDLVSGAGEREVFGAANKRHPADFALWKFTKPGEPSWPSPWGDGRPGWHSECVVMSLDLLGDGFDLHCGGMDLKFPHHENERAQAVALGREFARHWMHNGFVVDTEGEKMSKSLGNVSNLLDLVELYDPRAYRLVLLQTHYRGPVRVGQDNIDAAVNALAGLDAFASRTADVARGATSEPTVLERFRALMDNDLDTPSATALLFDTVRQANAALDVGDATAASLAAAALEICRAFGLELRSSTDVPAEVLERAAALDQARANKDFATADTVRQELQEQGWIVETTKAGTSVRKSGTSVRR